MEKDILKFSLLNVQNKMKKLLTVGIPTYNRPETLVKILDIVSKYPINECDILISDDSTNDQVKNLIKKKKIKNLKYFKNKKNIGFSKNVRNIYKKAKTKYVWIVCDDDLLFKNSFEIISNQIKKNNAEVIYFNAIRKTIFGVDEKIIKSNYHTNIADNNFYSNFLKGVFISIIVLKKNKSVEKYISKIKIETNVFIQLSLVLLTLSKKINFAVCNKVIVRRLPGQIYGDFYRFMYSDVVDSVLKVKHAFSNKIIFNFLAKHATGWFKVYAAYRINCISYSSFNLKKSLTSIKKFMPVGTYFFILVILFIRITPKFLLKIMLALLFIQKFSFKKGITIYRKRLEELYAYKRDTNFQNYN